MDYKSKMTPVSTSICYNSIQLFYLTIWCLVCPFVFGFNYLPTLLDLSKTYGLRIGTRYTIFACIAVNKSEIFLSQLVKLFAMDTTSSFSYHFSNLLIRRYTQQPISWYPNNHHAWMKMEFFSLFRKITFNSLSKPMCGAAQTQWCLKYVLDHFLQWLFFRVVNALFRNIGTSLCTSRLKIANFN